MKIIFTIIGLIIGLGGLALLVQTNQARPLVPQKRTDFNTEIIVNSGTDPDNSSSKTCAENEPCTLRRAIVEAGLRADDQRPVLISFNIPAEEGEGFDEQHMIWEIQLQPGTDGLTLPQIIGGRVTIDGFTQPGGRDQGPKIFLVGPGDGAEDALLVGSDLSGQHDGNELFGLGFQNFNNHITLISNQNLIYSNWFGLTSDGLAPALRNADQDLGSGAVGVNLSPGVMDNVLGSNAFLGLTEYAVVLRGERNGFADNFVGTDANGQVKEKQTEPNMICTAADWLGGSGLFLEGSDHSIFDNYFSGLNLGTSQIIDRPSAIVVTGSGHYLEDNYIGLDMVGNRIGVCGRGIEMRDGPTAVQLWNNTIVDTGLSGIVLEGPSYDSNSLYSNVIWQDKAWPEFETAIKLGASLPDSMKNFLPAEVQSIADTTVRGRSGASSTCRGCRVELFLDDGDEIVEALQPLAVVTADDQGYWEAEMPAALDEEQGIRTISTLMIGDLTIGLSAGTSTGLSVLYIPNSNQPALYLPVIISGPS